MEVEVGDFSPPLLTISFCSLPTYISTMSSTQQDAGPSTITEGQADAGKEGKKPVVILCIGMAGSVSHNTSRSGGMTNPLQGKTTLMQRLNSHLHSHNTPPYILNLDPAVAHMPYTANIDIRDTVDYKEVMKQ